MATTRVFQAFPLAMMGFVAAILAAVLTGLAPEPDPVPRRWELEVIVGPMRVTTIEAPGTGPKAYYYLTYRVVNSTGEDRLFAPIWELSSGRGAVIKSGRDVPRAVTDQLMNSTQNAFIEDQIGVVGTILQGPDNAKDGIVIWPAVEMEGERITVYAAGFSGETATIALPGSKTKAVLRKTLRLDFQSPGSLLGQGSQPLDVMEKHWIMR